MSYFNLKLYDQAGTGGFRLSSRSVYFVMTPKIFIICRYPAAGDQAFPLTIASKRSQTMSMSAGKRRRHSSLMESGMP